MTENITAVCPECLAQYSLKPDVAGKRMRCTDDSCGAVFTVTPIDTNGKAVAVEVSVADHGSPTIPPENGNDVVDWQAAPPPVRIANDGQAAPPPVRTEKDNDWSRPPPVRTAPTSLPAYLIPKAERSRRSWWVFGLIGFVIVMAGWGGFTIIRNLAQAEERLVEEAEKAYAESKFGDAAQKYRTLIEKYPRGIRAGEYRFLAALSELRRLAGVAPPEPDTAFHSLSSFLTDHGGSAYLTSRRQEVFDSAMKVHDDLIRDGTENLAGKSPNVPIAESRYAQAKQSALMIERTAPPGVDVAVARQRLDGYAKALEQVRKTVAIRNEIVNLLGRPRPDLEAARELIRQAGLTNDGDVSAAWQRAEESLRKLVTYQESIQQALTTLPSPGLAGIVPEPRGPAAAGPRVPALANGLLYALEARSGRLAWLERLGIDAKWLPMRIAGANDEEHWLIVSTDPLGLCLRKAGDGTLIWFQPLEVPPIGPPVIAQKRIFVALSDPRGRVLEFNAQTGQRNGFFETGQMLAGGLSIAPGSTRLYVPALGQQVFVLDFGGDDVGLPPRCVSTLNTEHAPGTLRLPPAVVSGPDDNPTLLLTVADGIGDSSLWLVRIGDATRSIPAIEKVRLSGWSWFPPSHDPERLAAITDRGELSLLGLRRPGAFDSPVFPLLDKDHVSVSGDRPAARGLIAHADESNLIILSGGQLRQWLLGIDRARGRQLKPGWSVPIPLGSPIGDAWPEESGAIVLTSQRTETAMSLATSIRRDTGAVLWQRPLGFSTDLQAAMIGDQLVTIDPRGSIAAFAVNSLTSLPNSWRLGGRELAGPVPMMLGQPHVVMSNNTMMAVMTMPNGILTRRVAGDFSIIDRKVELSSPLAGRPGVNGDDLILPLQNGQLVRVSLADAAPRPSPGPTWRAAGVGSDIAGQITHWHDQSYLLFDGSRRLTRLTWTSGTDYDLGTSFAVERPRRLIGRPALLPGSPPRTVIADAGGAVLLLAGDRLETERVWRLGDDKRRITNGPVVIGTSVYVVINDRELICLDPGKPVSAWTFRMASGFNGMPTAFAGGLVISDRDGRLWLIDPATGQSRKPEGFQLPGSLSTTGSMFAIDADRLLVMLTDGSAIVVTTDQLLK